MARSADHVVRVEKGRARPEELAAIIAVLITRAAGQSVRASVKPRSVKAGWRRLERALGFCPPHSWRN
jgi:hypothetical protein